MKLILLSPPGGGKGTHCAWLTEETGIAHVSSGDLFRDEIARGTDLGRRMAEYTARGDLVPDDLVFELITPAVVEAVRSSGGYLLDGFPRSLPQAQRAAEIWAALDMVGDAVVYLTASEPVLVERLLARAAKEGRVDDSPDVIRHRLAVFAEATAPLVDYYRARGILLEVDADRSIDRIRVDLRQLLGSHGLLPARDGAPEPPSTRRRPDNQGSTP